jgi:hypothetical protein
MKMCSWQPAGPHAIAQFDFEAEEADELAFFKDDVIVLLEKSVSLDRLTGIWVGH